ncbi:hypothetical protein [Sneathiella sp.]|uniref:hypothetical protein n=1 Tax=Sneathiella sp. TaxID=1964365 RepID=UPI0025E59A14|nr:hypothetical protein [Sneathiella sp.]|tara:strand:+ start:401 stop:622 length:222 start_codon:yes stop_codon:yes gene_type:complete
MFSPMKIILILLVIGAVFLAHRIYRNTIVPNLEKSRKNKEFKGSSADKMLDLEECPRCGSFVADLSEHSCKDK